jgi:hypothetical protein
MELPVTLQVAQFLVSCGLGSALGLVYDLLRAPRRRWPRLTRCMDALFCILLALSLPLLALYVGRGRFRLFFYPGLFFGALAYFRLLSPVMFRFFSGCLGVVCRFFRLFSVPFQFFYKKTKNIAKNVFSSAAKWVTIKNRQKQAVRKRRVETGGTKDEISQIVSFDQAGGLDPGGIRHDHPGFPAVPDLGQAGGSRGSVQKHHQRRRRKPASPGRHRQH